MEFKIGKLGPVFKGRLLFPSLAFPRGGPRARTASRRILSYPPCNYLSGPRPTRSRCRHRATRGRSRWTNLTCHSSHDVKKSCVWREKRPAASRARHRWRKRCGRKKWGSRRALKKEQRWKDIFIETSWDEPSAHGQRAPNFGEEIAQDSWLRFLILWIVMLCVAILKYS